jgi:hypothetical protein
MLALKRTGARHICGPAPHAAPVRRHHFTTVWRTSGWGSCPQPLARFHELISPEWWTTLWGIRWKIDERARQSWTVWPLKRSLQPGGGVWG